MGAENLSNWSYLDFNAVINLAKAPINSAIAVINSGLIVVLLLTSPRPVRGLVCIKPYNFYGVKACEFIFFYNVMI